MKGKVTGLRYEHAKHGVFFVYLFAHECLITRVWGPTYSALRTEKLGPAKDRHEARRIIRDRIAVLDAASQSTNTPVCTGEGQVSCG